MKLTVSNSRFAVVKTAFHGGGIVSLHKSLNSALKSKKCFSNDDCRCGCCRVIPITDEARRELAKYMGDYADDITLFNDLPAYEPDMFYGIICT